MGLDRRRHGDARLRLLLRMSRIARWHCYVGQRTLAWVFVTVVAAVIPVRMVASPAFRGAMSMGAATLAEGSGAGSVPALHERIIGVPKWASVVQPWVRWHGGELRREGLLRGHCRGYTHHVCREKRS